MACDLQKTDIEQGEQPDWEIQEHCGKSYPFHEQTALRPLRAQDFSACYGGDASADGPYRGMYLRERHTVVKSPTFHVQAFHIGRYILSVLERTGINSVHLRDIDGTVMNLETEKVCQSTPARH